MYTVNSESQTKESPINPDKVNEAIIDAMIRMYECGYVDRTEENVATDDTLRSDAQSFLDEALHRIGVDTGDSRVSYDDDPPF